LLRNRPPLYLAGRGQGWGMGEAISAERLSDLIGLIYDCAIEPARWPVALDAIRREIGGANASLDLIGIPDGASLLNVNVNIPASYAAAIPRYTLDAIDMWGGTERLNATPLDIPSSLRRMNPGFDRIPCAKIIEWSRPQGLDDILAVWLARDAEAYGVVGFGRFAADGPYGDRELDVVQLLVPHLQRAATINRLQDLAALQRASFESLFDTLSVPILIVHGDMRLVHANSSAHVLLDRRAVLDLNRDLLVARHLGTHRALAAAVYQATTDSSALGRKGFGIPLPQDDGSLGALHVLPLGRDGRTAAIFVAPAMYPFIAAPDVIKSLFGLTPSEARIFAHIAAGRTIAGAADALGVEESTVRSHLKRVYDKTGVRRQAELVQMAASLAVPVTH
jgi:DNA-binding CsgD family transcriptional regulator